MNDQEECGLWKEKITLNDVMKQIGSFNRFQIRLAITVCIAVMINSISRFEYVFTAARTPTRCHISECDSEVPDFSPGWLSNAIPRNNGVLDNCHRYVASSNITSIRYISQEICPAAWFDANKTEKCDRYVYKSKDTVVYDFDLACDEWNRSLIGSTKFAGVFFGLQISGIISDKFGRRFAFLICVAVTAVLGLSRSLVTSYYTYLTLMFIELMFGGGVVSVSFILLAEVVDQKYRAKSTAALFTSIACGYLVLGGLSWFVKSWRLLLRVIYSPVLILLTYFWILNESVRWLQSKGRYEDADNIIRKIARVNNRTISDSTLLKLKISLVEERQNAVENTEFLPFLVFGYKRILFRCLILPVCWISCTLIYYGVASNSLNIKGNGYLNFMCVSLSEILAYTTVPFVLDKFGRKQVIIAGYFISATCMIVHIFLEVQIIIYIGLYGNACVIMTLYLYTSELYPTKYRNRFFGYHLMMGRVGAVIAPTVPYMEAEIWKYLPSIIFGGFSVMSGLLMTLLPETVNKRLPESMEEANNMGIQSD